MQELNRLCTDSGPPRRLLYCVIPRNTTIQFLNTVAQCWNNNENRGITDKATREARQTRADKRGPTWSAVKLARVGPCWPVCYGTRHCWPVVSTRHDVSGSRHRLTLSDVTARQMSVRVGHRRWRSVMSTVKNDSRHDPNDGSSRLVMSASHVGLDSKVSRLWLADLHAVFCPSPGVHAIRLHRLYEHLRNASSGISIPVFSSLYDTNPLFDTVVVLYGCWMFSKRSCTTCLFCSCRIKTLNVAQTVYTQRIKLATSGKIHLIRT